MMKHDVMVKPLPISVNKDIPKKSLWKTRSSSETATPKSPMTKAFDFLPWTRSKKSSSEKSKSSDGKNKNDLSPTGSGPSSILSTSPDDKKDNVNHQRNIFRNGLIRDILGDRLNKEERSLKKSNVRRPRQVTSRNKSLDINELINCVEKELNGSSGDKTYGGEKNQHRFLDDTFIENIMRAKEAYQRNLQEEEENEDRQYNRYSSHHAPVECNDTEDEYFYQQQQELAQLYPNSDPRKSPGNLGSGSTSPKHILFNDENTVYLIKKEQPVNKSLKNCDKNGKPPQQHHHHHHQENILKARLKFKKLSSADNPSSNSTSHGDYKSTVLNNQRVLGQDKMASGSINRRSILQRQNTNPEDYSGYKPCTSPDVMRKRSPSAGRYQQHKSHSMMGGYSSPHYQRRKSLTEGLIYDHPATTSLHDTGGANSSTSSMGSGASTGGILNDRPKTDKPRKKLSFREPVVADKRRSRRQSAETVCVTTNGVNVQPVAGNATNGNSTNCDNLVNSSRRSTPSNDVTTPTEEDIMQVSPNGIYD